MNRMSVTPVETRSAADAHRSSGSCAQQRPNVVSGVRRHPSTNPPIELNRPVTAPSSLGQILLGDGRDKITFEEVLGAGGMGVVYAGFHRVTSQPVVIKVIRPEYAHIPELVARFQREAEILASVASPGVVKLLDCDVTTTGLPYIVLERLDGYDLSDLLETQGKLKTNDALSLASEVAQVLAPVHAKGIVHRDIKPDNLFVHKNPDGSRQIKLLDFGVALARETRRQLTLPGTTMGSLHYMAPEQLTNCHAVTPAADVWSLGVVLFQMLSGELPFPGQSEAEFSSQVLNKNALNLRSVAPGVTKELSQLVARCLHKDPWKRYSDAGELAQALSKYMRQQRGRLRLPTAIARVKPKMRRDNTRRAATSLQTRWSKRHIAAVGIAAGIAFGSLLPHHLRDELSRATINAFATPLHLVSDKP
jgi:eukaryotic-like serine/threonine-protein kinase